MIKTVSLSNTKTLMNRFHLVYLTLKAFLEGCYFRSFRSKYSRNEHQEENRRSWSCGYQLWADISTESGKVDENSLVEKQKTTKFWRISNTPKGYLDVYFWVPKYCWYMLNFVDFYQWGIFPKLREYVKRGAYCLRQTLCGKSSLMGPTFWNLQLFWLIPSKQSFLWE